MRKLGLRVLASRPYVAYKRKQLIKLGPNLTEEDKKTIAKISCCISPSDTMFDGDVPSYFLVGLSAQQAIDAVLKHCPVLVVQTILDFPSGCGRVGRYLAARFPKAEITACDLDREMVDFCAEEFGMVPVYSQTDFDKINFGQKYDLIWCGSLMTHLNAEAILHLLRLFDRHLKPKGVVVFTTQGDYVANCLKTSDDWPYLISKEAAKRAVETYSERDFAFSPYIGKTESEQYGLSLTAPIWIRSQCASIRNWKELLFCPQGWDNHQDVYGYSKE